MQRHAIYLFFHYLDLKHKWHSFLKVNLVFGRAEGKYPKIFSQAAEFTA